MKPARRTLLATSSLVLLASVLGAGAATAGSSCHFEKATITGTRDDDRIRGTARADVIVARGGDDVIEALGGNDIVCGGRGRDVISGGPGHEGLYGGGGPDYLFGGVDRDFLSGGGGPDRLKGGKGADDLAGWTGSDRLLGGPGSDTVYFGRFGFRQRQRIVADLSKGVATGEGNDVLSGIQNLTTNQFECECRGVTFIGDEEPNILRDWGSNYATDVFKGRGGNDVLLANTGPDRFLGGAGDDRFLVGYHYDDEVDGDDVFRGGVGTDTLDYSDPYIPPSSVTVDLAAGTATGPNSQTDVVSGFENVVGTPGDDVLSGDASANHLKGRGGVDELNGREGDDYLDGGGGENRNDGGDGTDECVNPDPSEGAVNCESP